MQSFVVSVGSNEPFDVPRTMIGAFNVIKNYDDMILPLYYVNFQAPLWLYEQMTADPENIRVTMNLQYTLVDDPDRALNGDCQLITEIAGRFAGMIPTTTEMADASHQNQISKDSGSYGQNFEFSEGATVEMAIYNENAYKASFDNLNMLFSNVAPMDVLTWCLNKSKLNNVLVQQGENNTVYDQFSVLPESGIKNILRIVDEFKFHKTGSIVFFDLLYGYILSKEPGCKVWRNNEHKCVYILTESQFSETMESYTGIWIDNNEKFTLLAITEDGFETKKPDNSPLMKEQPNMELLTVTTKNALLETLSPNKEYRFTMDDISANNHGGTYRLHSVEMDCSQRGEFLDPSFTIILRK